MCCNKIKREVSRKENCGCKGSGHGLKRRFISESEKIENLKNYKNELLKEIAGIDEELNR